MDRGKVLALVPFERPAASELLPNMTDEERRQHWHLVLPDGRDLVGGRASAHLLALLPPVRWIGIALVRWRLWWLLSPFDAALKRLRGPLGRFVKDVEAPYRFP